MSALTNRVSVGSWILAHGWRRGLHPWWRHAIWVGRHRRSSHIGHGGREVVRSSVSARCARHAMEVSVISWTRAHPRRSVVLQRKKWQLVKILFLTRKRNEMHCQLTGGGCVLLGPEARGAPPWVLECPPPEVGTGASPNSAMSDRYSLSIRALSWADWGGSPPVALWAAKELNKAKGQTST